MHRRRFLASAVGGTLFAGCLTTGPGGSGTDPGGDEPGRNEDGAFYDVSDYAPNLAAGDLPPDEHAVVVHVRSEAEAEGAFTTDSLVDEARAGVEEFVADTDFEAATLFYVQTRAPNTCYGLELEALEREGDGGVTGSAAARDQSDPDEGCGAAEITPSRLIRVRGDPDPPTGAEFEVTDGWDETETVGSVPPEEYDPSHDESDDRYEPGDAVTVSGLVANEGAEARTVAVAVTAADGETVFDEEYAVESDQRARFKFDAEVGAEYTAEVRVDDRETVETFEVAGRDHLQILLGSEGEPEIRPES